MNKNTEGFVDFIVRERMQQEFSRMQETRPLHKRETKDNLEKKFQKALEMLPPEQVKAVMEHYNSVFETGAENEACAKEKKGYCNISERKKRFYVFPVGR